MQAIVLAKEKASVDQRKIELENRKKKTIRKSSLWIDDVQ